MDTDGRLLWLHLATKTASATEISEPVHELEFLPELKLHDGADISGGIAAAYHRWSPVFLVGDTLDVDAFDARPNGALWLFFDTKPVELARISHHL